ncbi:MAG: prepilin-type N-terminal cleavage/methylation domain-containing protein [Candidatus Omnitrophica bacterium]|nr:prepilin-type N-terminal cleavage/methylation domain-containing protein [Candidatus Omnitrophota bacterium]
MNRTDWLAPKTGSPGFRRKHAFTLIELLIVIAIILILIAIALPNFLEAQERARVARANGHLRTMETAVFAFQTQYGFLYSDYFDPFLVTLKTRNRGTNLPNVPCPTSAPNPPSEGGLDFPGSGEFQKNFYAPSVHCPLTTPIKFVDAAVTVDPWSDGTVPVGMDSRYLGLSGDDPKKLIYSAYFVSGPDRAPGDWQRGTGPSNMDGDPCPNGLPYSPTNGTKSRGDLWMIMGDWAYLSPAAENACETGKKEYAGMRRTY